MPAYDNATICINGHEISSRHKILNVFCDKCGAKTVTNCNHCGADIRGKENIPGVVNLIPYSPPSYCYHCGNPFPWTASALEVAKELIADDDMLDNDMKEKLSNSLPDVITETPKTNLAATRMKKAISVAGKFTAEGLRQFVIDFGCELIKSQLGI